MKGEIEVQDIDLFRVIGFVLKKLHELVDLLGVVLVDEADVLDLLVKVHHRGVVVKLAEEGRKGSCQLFGLMMIEGMLVVLEAGKVVVLVRGENSLHLWTSVVNLHHGKMSADVIERFHL